MNSNDGQSRFSFNKKVMTLPRIEHPSSRIDEEDQNSLDIRGKSRNGQGNGKLLRSESSTPPLSPYRRKSSSFKHNSNNSIYSQPISEIPSNVNAIYGEDRDKVRLPVFGKSFYFILIIFKKLKFEVVVHQVLNHHMVLKVVFSQVQ
jgi:hypothetical protein